MSQAGLAAFDDLAELDANVAVYAENRRIMLEGLANAGFDELAGRRCLLCGPVSDTLAWTPSTCANSGSANSTSPSPRTTSIPDAATISCAILIRRFDRPHHRGHAPSVAAGTQHEKSQRHEPTTTGQGSTQAPRSIDADAVASLATMACPACGERKGLSRRWTKMADACPNCGLVFGRFEGQ
ncbi:MAG: hypothetical protein R2710_29175 [Acidimicrobiales bacterium]